MEIQPIPIEETYHEDPRRLKGVARLAMHYAFEHTMQMADRGEITRDHALNHLNMVVSIEVPKIYSAEGID